MIPIDRIKDFLSFTSDISIGYNEINFFDAENLDEGQIGYSVDTNGISLVDCEGHRQILYFASCCKAKQYFKSKHPTNTVLVI